MRKRTSRENARTSLSTDKIGVDLLFPDGLYSRVFTRFNAFQKPRHVIAERTHRLHSLFVAGGLVRVVAVYFVPIGGGYHGHGADGEIFVHHIERGGASRAAAADHRGRGLIGKQFSLAVKRPDP